VLFIGVLGFGAAMFRVPASAGVTTKAVTAIKLSAEAKTLLTEAAQDPSGLILFERFGASVDLHTNGKIHAERRPSGPGPVGICTAGAGE
jgi:hypothetical protein